ncbi:MAG: carboxypeptidase-like regulatory domain-containing protein, partial [Pyrinomonadaceae bacterium]
VAYAQAAQIAPDYARLERPSLAAGPTAGPRAGSSGTVGAGAGALSVISEPEARIRVESLEGGAGYRAMIPAGERVVRIDNLRPGRYLVTAMHPGFQPTRAEVSVEAGRTSDLTLNLRPGRGRRPSPRGRVPADDMP